MKTIILRLGNTAPTQVSWLGVGEGAAAISWGSLAEAGVACREAQVIVLVPATDVLLTRVAIPGRNRKRMILAAPFALEEQLADDIETLHFAFGPRNADATLDVAVVSKRLMRHWQELLREAGLEPACLTSEALALPYLPGSWTLLLERETALLRTGPRAGLGVDRHNIEQALLAEQGAATLASPQLQIYQTEAASHGLDLQRLPLSTIITAPALVAMGQGFDPKAVIDLLQGEFGGTSGWQELQARWQRPLLLVLVVIVLKVGLMGIELAQNRRESMELGRRIEAVYRQTFPEAKQVVNPRTQMEQQLAALGQGQQSRDTFLPLLTSIAPDLGKTAQCTVQRLRYHGNAIELELTLATLADLDGLKERLQSHGGLAVEIRTASNSNDLVAARLEIKEARP
jgi:general secretion pathway protein L